MFSVSNLEASDVNFSPTFPNESIPRNKTLSEVFSFNEFISQNKEISFDFLNLPKDEEKIWQLLFSIFGIIKGYLYGIYYLKIKRKVLGGVIAYSLNGIVLNPIGFILYYRKKIINKHCIIYSLIGVEKQYRDKGCAHALINYLRVHHKTIENQENQPNIDFHFIKSINGYDGIIWSLASYADFELFTFVEQCKVFRFTTPLFMLYNFWFRPLPGYFMLTRFVNPTVVYQNITDGNVISEEVFSPTTGTVEPQLSMVSVEEQATIPSSAPSSTEPKERNIKGFGKVIKEKFLKRFSKQSTVNTIEEGQHQLLKQHFYNEKDNELSFGLFSFVINILILLIFLIFGRVIYIELIYEYFPYNSSDKDYLPIILTNFKESLFSTLASNSTDSHTPHEAREPGLRIEEEILNDILRCVAYLLIFSCGRYIAVNLLSYGFAKVWCGFRTYDNYFFIVCLLTLASGSPFFIPLHGGFYFLEKDFEYRSKRGKKLAAFVLLPIVFLNLVLLFIVTLSCLIFRFQGYVNFEETLEDNWFHWFYWLGFFSLLFNKKI
ncbi:hypothetical protein ABK040_014928 [Willaertia magna]